MKKAVGHIEAGRKGIWQGEGREGAFGRCHQSKAIEKSMETVSDLAKMGV
jgi:hypothetical protein